MTLNQYLKIKIKQFEKKIKEQEIEYQTCNGRYRGKYVKSYIEFLQLQKIIYTNLDCSIKGGEIVIRDTNEIKETNND